jgi:Ni/Co efflux regulator RcnB
VTPSITAWERQIVERLNRDFWSADHRVDKKDKQRKSLALAIVENGSKVMKTRWWAGVLFTAVLAVTASAALAQYQGRERSAQSRETHTQYNDGERQAAHDWYNQHQDRPPVGFRPSDRLPPEAESRLQPGATFDRDLRRRAHPVPPDLRRRLPNPPSGYRHVAVGGHIALIDRQNHISDVIHLEINK